jgi:starch synthase (maltosyl-transferring)
MKQTSKTSSTAAPLARVRQALRRCQRKTAGQRFNYRVPSVWSSPGGIGRERTVNPFAYYLSVVESIAKKRLARPAKPTGGEWTQHAVVYNMFIRTATAYDHNGNGMLDLPVNADGFRETGTFLKAIALLPYIQRLGATTVHLLPVTSIGHDGNKGNLGSPYAIRNPYELDENLAEPSLGLDAKTEFAAFVEAAHRLGLRVMAEFVFRTAAKDADWVRQHPDWFYWIRDDVPARPSGSTDPDAYGSPVFSPEELQQIHEDVNAHRFGDLLAPPASYRAFFTDSPRPGNVREEQGRLIGTLEDGTRVRIPGAFADWPPDDNQPPWNDVTYLKMYSHPDFNYIAYNTIRMYDTRLAQRECENQPLWKKVIGIIPYYQSAFNIDGVMIDMGHALPMELKSEMVRKARKINPDFAFWDENFTVTKRSREEGYNAVLGYLWIDQRHPERLRAICAKHASEGFPIPYFATPETHNTPRAATRPGGVAYARWAMVINAFLPAVPYIHAGYELAERLPINTGLDFTDEELATLPSATLPLFSARGYNWTNTEAFPQWVSNVLKLRARYEPIVTSPDPATFTVLGCSDAAVLAYARRSEDGKKRLAVVGSMDFQNSRWTQILLDTRRSTVRDLLSNKSLEVKGDGIELALNPGECIVFEF